MFHPHPKYDDESWTVKIENHFKQLSRGNIFCLKIITKPLRRYRALFQCCRQSILTLTECVRRCFTNMIALFYTWLYRLKVVNRVHSFRISCIRWWDFAPIKEPLGNNILVHYTLTTISDCIRLKYHFLVRNTLQVKMDGTEFVTKRIIDNIAKGA